MTGHLRDPTSETSPVRRGRRARLDTFVDRTVALLDIGKMRGDEFVDRLDANLAARGVATKRYRKPTNTRVAPTELIQDVALECHAVILALSD